MADQYISTSRLANVIQLIALGQQSGILRVVRGHGAAREMGQIQFIAGQPTAALLGQLTGVPAMNVLNNWGESFYMFDETETADERAPEAVPTPAYGAWPSGDAGWADRGTSSRLSGFPGGYPSGGAGSWPSQSTGASLGQMPRASTPPAPLNGGASGPLGGGAGGAGSMPSQPGMASSYPSGPQSAQAGQPGQPASGVSYPGQIPRRTARSELTDPLPLDRRERMVLLLVDGRRSVVDLGRLTRRGETEMLAVLGNLKMLGLIE